jgi:hypothetical protein
MAFLSFLAFHSAVKKFLFFTFSYDSMLCFIIRKYPTLTLLLGLSPADQSKLQAIQYRYCTNKLLVFFAHPDFKSKTFFKTLPFGIPKKVQMVTKKTARKGKIQITDNILWIH